MNQDLEQLRDRLAAHGQAHLLRFYDELAPERQSRLLDQIRAIDFDELGPLIETYVRQNPTLPMPADPEPAPFYARGSGGSGGPYDVDHYRGIGEELIRQGKVAAFTVAGGQGTRLGWNGPKGTYPATVVTGKPLFRCFAEQLLAAERKYGVTIPWCIMTSPMNDEATREFFEDNNCFGLVRKNIFMFPQAVLPSVELGTARLLLSEKDELAVNPDGHGGSLKALRRSGAIEDLAGHGIEHISYFQVDNPVVKVIDPLFLGLHAAAPDSSGEMSSKMVRKAQPKEKVGVFARADGRTMVIEYTDLPLELANATDPSGELRFIAGSIAVHLFGVAFVDRLTRDMDHFALPYHRAEKKVPYIDVESGERVEPAEANAVKLETFIFDAIPLAEASIVLETDRVEEFAPIKNADGVDSPATSHQLQSERNGRWLESHRVDVPHDDEGRVAARIEISPLTALEPADLEGIELPEKVAPGADLVLQDCEARAIRALGGREGLMPRGQSSRPTRSSRQ